MQIHGVSEFRTTTFSPQAMDALILTVKVPVRLLMVVCRLLILLLVTNRSVHRAWNDNCGHDVITAAEAWHGWLTDRWTDGRTSFDWGRNLVTLIPGSSCGARRRRRRKCHKSRHRRRDVFNTLVMNSESTPPRRRWGRIICRTHWSACFVPSSCLSTLPLPPADWPIDRPPEKSREFVSGFVAVEADMPLKMMSKWRYRLPDHDERAHCSVDFKQCSVGHQTIICRILIQMTMWQ